MDENAFKAVVLNYLKEKGFKEAEQAFEKAIRSNEPGSMALADRLSATRGVVEQLVETFNTSDEPQSYVDAFDRFSTWISNSLDVHKTELSRLLHPVFLHTYIVLVQKDAPQMASALLHKYQKRLVSMEGVMSRARAAELSELSSVAVKQHLTSNAFARQLLSGKQTVRLSPYARDLLIHYLHSSRGLLGLANLINTYINIDVTTEGDQLDATQQVDEVDVDDSAGADLAENEAANVNTSNINLGLLKNNVEDRYADSREQRALEEGKAGPSGGGGEAGAGGEGVKGEGTGESQAAPAAGSKKSKKEAAKSAAAAGEAQAAAAQQSADTHRLHPGERSEPQAWMPPLSDQVMSSWLTDIECRAPVGTSALPSCCFFTFANTRQTLNCADFTSGADKLAAGFADSSVRMYDFVAAQQAQESSMGDDDIDESERGVTCFYGHTGPVHAVSFSHDSRWLFSASGDGTVRAWSPELKHAICAYRGHLLPVWDVCAGPLGHHFVTGGADRTARVWSTDSVRMIRILAGHQADVDVVGWHPNCAYVATASSDRSVRLWDVATGTCVRFLTGLRSPPTCMAIHPDGKHISVGTDRGTVLVWELGSARRLASFKAHTGPVWSLSYSKGQGSLLASGGADETVKLWSTHTSLPSTPPTQDTPAPTAALPSPAEPSASKPTDNAPPAPPVIKPYTSLLATQTKSTSVTHVQFSNRNLLLAAGAFQLRQPPRKQQH